jgi:L-amino acid N-acyltransferase YncA
VTLSAEADGDTVTTRPAEARDAEAIAAIYNEGIEDRLATFETEARAADAVLAWLDELPVVVAEDEAGSIVAWASAPPSSPRPVYEGVREFSIYVARSHRGRGYGRLALAALLAECEARGWWKVTSRIFPENEASLALCRSLGFREVGVLRRHARLDGEWRDCVVVERLLGEAARD